MNRRNHLPSQPDATFYQPHIVGYMSVDGSRNYCPDISQLKFVTNIPRGKVTWDLNHNIDQAVDRTTDCQEEKRNVLLNYLYHERKKLNLPDKTFISHRNVISIVMYSAFYIKEPVCIRATLFKNHIHMKKIQSETEKLRSETCTDFEKQCRAWGCKFEQYMTSDEPNLAPDINKPVVENEEFSLVYCSQIGDHKLLYAAHTDGALANSNTANKPNTTDAQEIIQYLKSLEYLELRTTKEICNPELDRKLQARKKENFRRYKMLHWWCQCYLGNYKGLLVGFRDDSGVVRRLQWFDTAQIAQFCKIQWDPQTTLNFLNRFLTFVKNYFETTDYDSNSNIPRTVDFFIDPEPNSDFKAVVNENESLLQDWYVEALNEEV